MTTENGKKPTMNGVVKTPNLQYEGVVLTLETTVGPVPLYGLVFSDGNDTIYAMDQVGDKNDDSNWLDEIALKGAINGLNDREKRIFSVYLFQGKTQIEVAGEIDISQI